MLCFVYREAGVYSVFFLWVDVVSSFHFFTNKQRRIPSTNIRFFHAATIDGFELSSRGRAFIR